MLFNTIDFAIFLPIVFVLYWFFLKDNLKAQNLLIVVASYIFYGWWNWKFLSLIAFSTLVDFLVGRTLESERNKVKRQALLWTSILVNLGFLGFFKYYNFFLDNFVTAFSFFGSKINASSLNIVLPVGISFYTFQTLSYTIDVYKKKLKPTHDIVAFSAFVGFFPQLVAGPIERASNLLPQFYKKRLFKYSDAVDGMRQILWGLFKKVVIADSCAVFVNEVFGNSSEMNGSALLLGVLFFAFQIYGDFSGYSDIAIGTARLFGFRLMKNFAFPYFSRDIAEFWRRWHISLSTWFRDYLYIPLGGSRGNIWLKVRNVLIIFIVSGFWHGANWTFIIWGLLNAVYFLPLILTQKNRLNLNIVAKNKLIPTAKEFYQISVTFALTLLAWVFFRAENVNHAIDYIMGLFSASMFEFPSLANLSFAGLIIIVIILFVVVEWIGREEEFAFAKVTRIQGLMIRNLIYSILAILIFIFHGSAQNFIYFQF